MQDYIQNLKMLEKEKRNSSRLSLEDKQKNGQMLSIGHFIGSPASLGRSLMWRQWSLGILIQPTNTFFSNLCGSSKPGLQKVYCCLFYLSGSDFLFPDEEPSSWPSVK